MKHAAIVLALLVPALLGACDDYPLFPDEDDVTLRTDQDQYAPGDTATLRIENDSGETIGYNLCSHLVQRLGDDGWEDTLYGHDGPCLAIWLELRHNDFDTHPAPLDANTPPGTYRFRTRIDMSDGEWRIYSPSFEVE